MQQIYSKKRGSCMNLTENKKTLAISGVVLGVIAAILAYMGNPKNMAMCIA